MYCSPIPEPADDSQDAMAIAYGDAINGFQECARRHKALVDWL